MFKRSNAVDVSESENSDKEPEISDEKERSTSD
jgi:hypothetical protein